MREIHKKINKKYFDLVASGQKTFEYRVNDFECESGDILILEEYEYDADFRGRKATGRVLKKKVGHVAKVTDFEWLKRPDVQADFEKYGAQIISLISEEE